MNRLHPVFVLFCSLIIIPNAIFGMDTPAATPPQAQFFFLTRNNSLLQMSDLKRPEAPIMHTKSGHCIFYRTTDNKYYLQKVHPSQNLFLGKAQEIAQPFAEILPTLIQNNLQQNIVVQLGTESFLLKGNNFPVLNLSVVPYNKIMARPIFVVNKDNKWLQIVSGTQTTPYQSQNKITTENAPKGAILDMLNNILLVNILNTENQIVKTVGLLQDNADLLKHITQCIADDKEESPVYAHYNNGTMIQLIKQPNNSNDSSQITQISHNICENPHGSVPSYNSIVYEATSAKIIADQEKKYITKVIFNVADAQFTRFVNTTKLSSLYGYFSINDIQKDAYVHFTYAYRNPKLKTSAGRLLAQANKNKQQKTDSPSPEENYLMKQIKKCVKLTDGKMITSSYTVAANNAWCPEYEGSITLQQNQNQYPHYILTIQGTPAESITITLNHNQYLNVIDFNKKRDITIILQDPNGDNIIAVKCHIPGEQVAPKDEPKTTTPAFPYNTNPNQPQPSLAVKFFRSVQSFMRSRYGIPVIAGVGIIGSLVYWLKNRT